MKRKIDTSSRSCGHFDYEHVVMGKSTALDNADYRLLISKDVRLQRLFNALHIKRGNILDIGCGGGTITNCLLYKFPAMHVYGCDISKSAIAVANSTPTSAKFSVMKNNEFPYKNEMFDACICFDVLEHVPDPDTYISETKRVLKKGGKLFFAIPCEGQPFSLTWILQKLKFGNHLTNKHIGHIHPEFTHEYIMQLMEKHGLRIISISYSEHFVTQCVRFIRFILPKELLELVVGAKHAETYYDRSIVKEPKNKKSKDMLMIVRILWLKLSVLFDAIEHTEARILKQHGFAAWKIFVLATRT